MRRKDGFTLVELLVVILIMGILMAFAVPQYSKTIENSSAQDAQVTLQAIASGVRMADMDRIYISNGSKLSPAPMVAAAGTGTTSSRYNAAQLVAKGYLSNLSYGSKYAFYVCSPKGGTVTESAPCCSASTPYMSACAVRIDGDYGKVKNGVNAWTYKVDSTGQCTSSPSGADNALAAPDCQ